MDDVVDKIANSEQNRPEVENSLVTLSLLNCFEVITLRQAEDVTQL